MISPSPVSGCVYYFLGPKSEKPIFSNFQFGLNELMMFKEDCGKMVLKCYKLDFRPVPVF